MGELLPETTVVTMALPFDQKWLWYPELNIVALSPDLDEAGRDQALDELQAKWRQSLSHTGVAEPDAVTAAA